MKKSILNKMSFILFCILLATNIFAECPTTCIGGCPESDGDFEAVSCSGADLSKPDELDPEKINENFDEIIESGQINKVPVNKIDENNLPAVIDLLDDKQLSELKSDQLTHSSNGKPNIDQISDLSKLNPEERDKALSALGRNTIATDTSATTSEPVTTSTNPETNEITINQIPDITITSEESSQTILNNAENLVIADDYISTDSARLFTYTTPDKLSIISASNIKNLKISNNHLEFDHADSLTTNQNWLATNTDSFSGSTLDFTLEHSDLLIINGITLTNLTNTTISKDNLNTYIKTNTNLSLTDSQATSSVLNGNLTISKQNAYTLSGKLQIIQSNYTENLISNNSIITLNPYLGIECIKFFDISSYTYSDKNNINKDFAIKNNNPSHTLCLKKDNTNYITNLNNSLFDFINNKANLNSKLEFYKYPIKQNNIISLAFTCSYTSNNLNYANLTFNNQLTIINRLNTFPPQTTLTNPSKAFAIKEHLNTTFVKLNLNSYSQPQILNYNDKIQINNNILMNNRLKCIKK